MEQGNELKSEDGITNAEPIYILSNSNGQSYDEEPVTILNQFATECTEVAELNVTCVPVDTGTCEVETYIVTDKDKLVPISIDQADQGTLHYIESVEGSTPVHFADNSSIIEEVLIGDTEYANQEASNYNSIVATTTDTYSASTDVIKLMEQPKGEQNDKITSEEDLESRLLFECGLCSQLFKTKAGARRHLTVNHAETDDVKDPLTFEICSCCGEPVDTAHTIGDYKCSICNKLFIKRLSLDRHQSIEHNEGEKYACVECMTPFLNKEALIKHMKEHPMNKIVRCPDCGREFSRKYHLQRHFSQTGCNGEPVKCYTCNVCNKVFHRKDNLADHLRVHVGFVKLRKQYFCKHCSKEFHSSALLNVHVRTHTGEKPYKCDICPKCFPSSGAMRKHRRMHTGEKPYVCLRCDASFAAKETLNRHMRTHTGDKPHACNFCGKSFIQASQLRAHIFHHTGENAYTCPHCNRAFNRKLRLTTHIKYMHEGAQPFNCSICKKFFFRKEDLSRHSLSHTGERPFECEICNKKFAARSSLKIHNLTHRKEPPCSCETCGRAFIRQDCLMRHMRARHRDLLEDIMANAERKRLQEKLFRVASEAAATAASDSITRITRSSLRSELKKKSITSAPAPTTPESESAILNELTLTESIKELLTILVDEDCLEEFGFPSASVDKVLDAVVERCGQQPVNMEDFDYLGRLRENAKLLFTAILDSDSVNALLNNQTVDEVISHVLRLAKSQKSA